MNLARASAAGAREDAENARTTSSKKSKTDGTENANAVWRIRELEAERFRTKIRAQVQIERSRVFSKPYLKNVLNAHPKPRMREKKRSFKFGG